MVTLRVVGASRDNAELLLSDKPKGVRATHSIEIDKRLLNVLQNAVYARREAARREEEEEEQSEPRYISRAQPTAVEPPRVPPREIQRMLRAGQSPKQVAKATGTDLEYVERFYQPIVYERVGVVADAHSLFVEKARLGMSALPLGDAVERNLEQRRVRMEEQELIDSWSATRDEGKPWVVTLTFPYRGRRVRAAWRFDARERLLEPMNRIALDLGWVAPGRTPRAPSSRRPATAGRKPAKKKPAAKRKPAARKPAARKPARKTVARKPAKKRSAAKRSTVRKPARRKPVARKAPARKKPAARKPTRKAPARKKPAARKAPARKKPAARKAPARKKPATRKKTSRRAPARRR